jgi:plasmid stabilization system protein ParE
VITVSIQLRAIADVDEIADRIAMDDLAAALRSHSAVTDTYDLIGRHPLVGSRRLAVDPRLRGLRSFGVIGYRNYLEFFLPSADAVRVLRVFHWARDTDAITGPVA